MNLRKTLYIAASLGALLAVNLWLRVFPVYFPQLKVQARGMVLQQLRQAVAQDVGRRFGQFDDLAKDKLLETRFAEAQRANKKDVQKKSEELYQQMKGRFQDDSGHTYLMELDCWHWARYVKNVLEKGRPGDEVVNGEQWDLYMLAPQGSYLHWDNFLFYLSAFLYRSFSLFHHASLFHFLFYVPLLFMAVLLVGLYFFSFRLGGYPAAIVSCLVVGMSQMFIPRSCAGWFDKDVLNILLPLLVVWSYLYAFNVSSWKRTLMGACLSAFWVGIFCFNWTFWWFIVVVVMIYEGVSLGVLALQRVVYKEENVDQVRRHVVILGAFLGFSLVWVLVFSGFKPLVELYRQLSLALILNKPLMSSIWPNVYSTVGELRKLNFKETMDAVGGVWVFSAACAMLLWLLIRGIFERSWEGHKRRSILLLSVWFLSMLFASSRGIRFVVFMLPPLGVALGWGINELYLHFRARFRVFSWAAATAACMIITGTLIPRGYSSATHIYPIMDDTWYQVLTMIDEKTPKDAILNSWWDFGDWFKVVGNRRVIFDGQSQDTPQAFWMGKALLSQDENKAVAILRMLNNGGNKAFEVINQYLKDDLRSVLLLESILGTPPEDAQRALLEYLPAPAMQQVMGLLYAKPAPAYFIVDPTLQYKMPAISFLGNWDFAKVYIVQNFNKQEKERIIDYLEKLGKNPEEMQRYYQEAFLIPKDKLDNWLSRPVQFMGGYSNGREQNGVVAFSNGMTYDLKNQMAKSMQGQIPRSIFTMREGQLVEIPVPGANADFSVLVTLDQERGWRCMLMSQSLGRSLFTRLYYLKAEGLTHFRTFVDAEEGNNFTRVQVIQW